MVSMCFANEVIWFERAVESLFHRNLSKVQECLKAPSPQKKHQIYSTSKETGRWSAFSNNIPPFSNQSVPQTAPFWPAFVSAAQIPGEAGATYAPTAPVELALWRSPGGIVQRGVFMGC